MSSHGTRGSCWPVPRFAARVRSSWNLGPSSTSAPALFARRCALSARRAARDSTICRNARKPAAAVPRVAAVWLHSQHSGTPCTASDRRGCAPTAAATKTSWMPRQGRHHELVSRSRSRARTRRTWRSETPSSRAIARVDLSGVPARAAMTIIERALDLVPDDSLIGHASPGAARD
jgi:hypothetical protein